MPAGVPVATVSTGASGAKNASLLALEILALDDKSIEATESNKVNCSGILPI